MRKNNRYLFIRLVSCLITIAAISLPSSASARDLEDEDKAGFARWCESLWKTAKAAAQNADKGVEEDDALEKLEAALRGSGIGPNAAHMLRTGIKGAYVRPSGESASKYAARVQTSCMNGIDYVK